MDNFIVIILYIVFVVVVLGGFFYAMDHAIRSDRMHEQHNAYVNNQQRCEAFSAWYVHSEDYHGLISCHRLDNHEQFYIVPETGLILFQMPRTCVNPITIRM